MCGRYCLYGNPSRYQDHFYTVDAFTQGPRYNVSPSQQAVVVQQDQAGERHFLLARWGLIPSWTKDPKQLNHPINAMAETAAIRPMFRHAFRKSRILVPADAFFEWQPAPGGRKQPYYIGLKDGSPLGFAGLLEHWHAPSGEDVTTFTILTTDANPLVGQIHNRMPVIVQPSDYARWLDPSESNVEALQQILRPYPERLMEIYPISTAVNSPKNDSPDVIKPESAAPSAP